MRLLLSVILLSFLGMVAVRADSENGPLAVTVSSDWAVKYDGSKGAPVYTLSKPGSENVLFTFSKWPAPGNAEQMPSFLDEMANKFLDVASRNPKVKLDSKTFTKGEFLGDPFSGNYVQFTVKGGMKTIMFMFSDGNGIWNGQYSGSSDGWIEAQEILKGIKKS